MKSTLQAYLRAGDMPRLRAALAELAAHEPPGYQGWSSSAQAGAQAADEGAMEAVRAQCKGCHDAHRESYRRELRATNLLW
jgi:cytochrome c553